MTDGLTLGGYSQDEIDAHESHEFDVDHLTHPQLLRALALARAHGHGWASEFDALGIDPAHRCEQLIDYRVIGDRGEIRCGDAIERSRPDDLRLCGECAQGRPGNIGCEQSLERWDAERSRPATSGSERAWQRTRRRKLVGASSEAGGGALARAEAAWSRHGEVAVDDLRALTLVGNDRQDPGIVAPGLDAEGQVVHATGSGRLSWLIRRDGSACLQVRRPTPEVYRVTFGSGLARLGCGPDARADVYGTTLPPAQLALEAARVELARVAAQCRELGYVVAVVGEDAEPDASATEVELGLEEIWPRGSVVVLGAEVGPEVVTREYADGTPATEPRHGRRVSRSALAVTRGDRAPAAEALYLRHVLTLRDALAPIGVEWEPQVEVVL